MFSDVLYRAFRLKSYMRFDIQAGRRMTCCTDAAKPPMASTRLTSLNITFLGTASAQPSSTRNHSSLALRLGGDVWLFDCGEATQHQIQRSNVKMGKIEKIFITHTHGGIVLEFKTIHICDTSSRRSYLWFDTFACQLSERCGGYF
jgi:tRNase Z endonuclease